MYALRRMTEKGAVLYRSVENALRMPVIFLACLNSEIHTYSHWERSQAVGPTPRRESLDNDFYECKEMAWRSLRRSSLFPAIYRQRKD